MINAILRWSINVELYGEFTESLAPWRAFERRIVFSVPPRVGEHLCVEGRSFRITRLLHRGRFLVVSTDDDDEVRVPYSVEPSTDDPVILEKIARRSTGLWREVKK